MCVYVCERQIKTCKFTFINSSGWKDNITLKQTSTLNDLYDEGLALGILAGVWRTSKCLHFFLHLFHKYEAANEKIKAIR